MRAKEDIKPEEIIDGNKLISKFMGFEVKISKHYVGGLAIKVDGATKNVYYHSSWEWLMPVYSKINQYILKRSLTDFEFATNTEQLHLNLWMELEDCSDNPIGLWFHVVEFIKWHNQNQK